MNLPSKIVILVGFIVVVAIIATHSPRPSPLPSVTTDGVGNNGIGSTTTVSPESSVHALNAASSTSCLSVSVAETQARVAALDANVSKYASSTKKVLGQSTES